MHAAAAGSVDVVKYLIKLGFDTDDITKKGFTAIVYAARSGSLSCVKALIEAGATYKNGNRRYNCFVEAATQGHLDIVKYLLDKGININVSTRDKKTAAMCAAQAKKFDVLKYLLMKGAKYVPDKYFIAEFSPELFEIFKKQNDIKMPLKDICTSAILDSNAALVGHLLDNYIDLKDIPEYNHWSFFKTSKMFEKVYNTKGFLKVFDMIDPIHYAGNLKYINMLESVGCVLKKEAIIEGQIIERIVTKTKDRDLALKLLDKIDDIGKLNQNSLFTNLINAFDKGEVTEEIVDIIMERFKDRITNFQPERCQIFGFKYFRVLFDSMDESSKNSIFFDTRAALETKYYDNYEYILNHGFDASEIDEKGNCPLHYMKSTNHATVDEYKKLIKLFTSHGCDINTKLSHNEIVIFDA
ncbi:hypothetical protein TVAG_228530 [Trichomonas vaginalis G3]|uniref:Ankyrin repeat protein n=1 Tax=Trichomonas vaginalis (strain ATCC PRA-98 / G3) TaxID=412133 RepID=A2DJ15_TRIV3|nr:protein ubiquitination [Trichomonas vaginalis G3]EAY19590.1 hypothetical protein TVAG_228530 [Trichomonas vaginalis G3]KAI5515921.1 protein ubiquitination [Trichomonas vaginalis G3]|eukprot:XP_001580576.1 hypothetical protein [Trichomonas vaginalis G3]